MELGWSIIFYLRNISGKKGCGNPLMLLNLQQNTTEVVNCFLDWETS